MFEGWQHIFQCCTGKQFAIKSMISYITIPNELLAIPALFKAASLLSTIRFSKSCNFPLSSPLNFHHPLPILRWAALLPSHSTPWAKRDAHFTPPSSLQLIFWGTQGYPGAVGNINLFYIKGLSLPIFPGTSLTLLFCSANTKNRNHLKSPAL